MSKQIWLGPLLGTNRSRLVDRCAALVSEKQGDHFLYLTASSPLLELVTESILDRAANQGLWGELPVYLFRGFVRRLLANSTETASNSPLRPRIPIDREELPLKRSLISQILKRLHQEQKLVAFGSLALRDGCVASIVSLIGEIQRAGKTPAELTEIIATRASELSMQAATPERGAPLQQDFDREVAMIYESYAAILSQNNLTEDDTNALQALQILKGTEGTTRVKVPWLEQVKLLVLDGFFDFTPVQGEILRLLIPQVDDVVVNLNSDERNPEIFKPFHETIDRIRAIADFEIVSDSESLQTKGALQCLRSHLFSTSLPIGNQEAPVGADNQTEIRYFDCTDRETEVRAIAKEIKRLLLMENYQIAEIALVVRERASYAETIARVMREESIPCNLNRKLIASEIPATRAALKLLSILDDLVKDAVLRMPQLADLIKSGYFSLPKEELLQLEEQFRASYTHLLTDNAEVDSEQNEKRMKIFGVGKWDADAIENVIAYVGGELRINDWMDRCRRIIAQLPNAEATKELLNIDTSEPPGEDQEAQLEDAETVQKEDGNLEKKRRPQSDVHPATMAWTMMVLKRVESLLHAVSSEDNPANLRAALMKLLDQLRFREEISKPIRHSTESELPRATLDFHALEALRRAFLTAVKSIQLTHFDGTPLTSLRTFIDEVRRCLGAQVVTLGKPQGGGLRIMEATDVRGLRFRAVFIAGLIEGGFPLGASRDWIYPHEERERLKHHGLTLEDISPNTLLKEEHYFYQAACRAIERLYLTRPLVVESDSETVASYYIEELRRAVAPAVIEKEDVARPDYDGKQLAAASSARELAVGLVRQEQRHIQPLDKTNLLPLPRVNAFLSLARNDGLLTDSALARIGIERERAGEGFGPYDGQIDNSDLLLLLKRRFGPDFVHSASGLSTFGNCAYRFFAQRVLKLGPRGEAALDLQALDAGKILHDILRRFFEQHRGERLDSNRRTELTKELLKVADDVFDQHEQVVPPLNKQIWKLDREIRKILLEQVLAFELDIQEKSARMGVVPARFELAFGGMKSAARDPHSTDEPLTLRRSTFVGEEVMQVSGQIDRVDIATDETLVAYDYKLSTGASMEDILAGRNLQLPIYLEALEQLFFPEKPVAGGGFYILRAGTDRRNKGMYRRDFKKDYLGIGARNSMLSEAEWSEFRLQVKERIWNFLDRMREGGFTVEPSKGKETCKFCDYVAVCRYERYRIDRKRRKRK